MMKEMSSREKVLASIVGGAAFVFLNFLVIEYFTKNQARLKTELSQGTSSLAVMKKQLADKALWEKRDAWLAAKQPVLGAEDAAGVKLLDDVKEVAKKHSVQIIGQNLRPVGRTPDYTSISVDMETTSTWESLIKFMHSLQGPEQFVVFEETKLKVDDKDATKMHANFKVAKWYAPKAAAR